MADLNHAEAGVHGKPDSGRHRGKRGNRACHRRRGHCKRAAAEVITTASLGGRGVVSGIPPRGLDLGTLRSTRRPVAGQRLFSAAGAEETCQSKGACCAARNRGPAARADSVRCRVCGPRPVVDRADRARPVAARILVPDSRGVRVTSPLVPVVAGLHMSSRAAGALRCAGSPLVRAGTPGWTAPAPATACPDRQRCWSCSSCRP